MSKFTDRFIRIPVKVYDKEQAELTGKVDYEDSWMKINPFEISHYKPTLDEDNNNLECTYLTMKSGDRCYVYYSVDKFEQILNDAQK